LEKNIQDNLEDGSFSLTRYRLCNQDCQKTSASHLGSQQEIQQFYHEN